MTIIENLVGLFDNVLITIHRILAIFHLLLQLNYEIVSKFLDLASSFVSGVHLVFRAVTIAVNDFFDQYGELCTNVVNIFVYAVQQFGELVVQTFEAVSTAFNYLLHWILVLCSLPNIVCEKTFDSIEKATRFASDLINFPVTAAYSVYDGSEMILTSIFNGCIYALTSVFNFCFSIARFFMDSTLAIVAGVVRVVIFLLLQPINAAKALVNGIIRVPLEAIIGLIIVLVICVCLLYLFKIGVFRYILVLWLRTAKRLLVASLRIGSQCLYKARYYLLPLVEMILMYTVPQVMIVFHVFRWAKTPIVTFIACARVVYNYVKSQITGVPTPNVQSTGEQQATTSRACGQRAQPANEQDERLLCIICQDSEKSVMTQPCRHVCMCRNCADEVLYEQRRCPMCRAYIREVLDVFL